MDVRRRVSFHASVHRIHVTQHVTQALVMDEMGHEAVCRPHKFRSMGVHVVVRGAQVEEIYLVNHAIEGLHIRSEEHTSELQSRQYLVCRLLLEKKTKPSITSDTRP